MHQNDEWKYRVGSDLWKNLIAKECEAVSKSDTTKPQWSEKTAPQGVYDWLKALEQKDKSFDFISLNKSCLVFQTGRLFLVGVPENAVNILENAFQQAKEDKNPSKVFLPHHVVLLTWEECHL